VYTSERHIKSVFQKKKAEGDPAGKSGSCLTNTNMREAPPFEEALVARAGLRHEVA